MKRLQTIWMLIAALVFSTAFISCQKENPNDQPEDGQDQPEDKPGKPDPEQLAKPILSIKDQNETSFTVAWEAIDNAAEYAYILNDEAEKTTTETSITFSDLNYGKYIIKVQARPGDSEKYTTSDWGEISIDLQEKFDADVRAEAYYKGDYFATGNGNAWINFIKGDLAIVEQDWEEVYIGDGMILCIDMNIPLADNPDYVKLTEGTFEMNGTTDLMTLNGNGDSYYFQKEGDNETSGEFTSGTVTVVANPEPYSYKITCTMKAGDKEITLKYNGTVRFTNRSGEGELSGLENDIEVNSLTQGHQMYFGDLFMLGESELYLVSLAADDFDLELNFGMGENVLLYFNVPLDSSTGLPSGTYKGMIDLNTATSAPAGTCLGGIYDYGSFMGCWYFHTGQQIESAIKDGEFTVENRGDGTYKISGYGKDGYGNKITINYDGKLPMVEAAM